MQRDDKDWIAIIKSQAKANQLEELEKKRLAEQRKKLYKEDLDRQVLMKQQFKASPDSEAYSKLNPSDRLSSNKTLARDYNQEIEFKNQQLEQDRYESMMQSREMNQLVQEAMEREKQAEREYKLKLVTWTREEIRRNEELKEIRRKQEDEERYKDREILERRIEENTRKEQHLKAVRNSHQNGLFEPEMESMKSYQQRQAYKERNDKVMKEKALKETKDALVLHLQAQDLKKNAERERMQREREDMELQVQYFKAQEDFEKEQRKKVMQDYRSLLEEQKNFAMEERLNDEQLNSRDKMLINKAYNGKAINLSLETIPDIDRKPLGVYNKQSYGIARRSIPLDTPKYRSSSLYSSHDPNKHNPILNPIDGTRSRGRVLSKLAQAGTSILC